MDSVTHIVLGACIGEAVFGKRLGKKAMLWGAVVQSIPDIDVIAAFWLNPTTNLFAHRGFTHSISFVIMFSFLLAWLVKRWHMYRTISPRSWMLFFLLQLFVHIFIDAFNNYGVGWFEPFSHYRVSFNALFVVDPFFSVWLVIAFIVLLFLNRKSTKRKFWWRFGLVMSSLYLCSCIYDKLSIDRKVREIAQMQHIQYSDLLITPVPLNNWLWYVALKNDSGYNIAYRSVFDKKREIDFRFFPRNEYLLKDVESEKAVQKLIRFSKGFYTVENWSDTLVFNDLRFGQILGWKDRNEKFVFHYFLSEGADNTYVVQRGRFAKWDWDAVKSLIRRVEGR